MIDRLCIHYFKKWGWRFVGPLPRSQGTLIVFYGPSWSIRQWVIARAVMKLTGFNSQILLPKHYWSSWRRPFLPSHIHLPLAESSKSDLKQYFPAPGNSKSNLALCAPLQFEGWSQDNSWMLNIAEQAKIQIMMAAFDSGKKELKFHTHFKPTTNNSTEWSFVERFINRYE